MADYKILVKAIIDSADLQAQLNKSTPSKPIKIKADVQLNDAQITSQIDKWQNQLVRMQVGKTGMFNTPEMQADLQKLSILMNSFGKEGGASVGQVNAAFDNLKTTLKVVEQNTKMIDTANKDVASNQKLLITQAQQLAGIENQSFDRRIKLADQYTEKLRTMQALNQKAFANPEVINALNNFQTKLSSFDGSKKSTDALSQSFQKLQNQVRITNGELNTANKQGMTFGSKFELAAKKVAIWAGATGLIYGALRQIGNGVQYIKDLNKVMTDTAIVTGETSLQMGQLVRQYNEMATSLGSTTLKVASGALELQRAGYDAKTTMDLLKVSTMQSVLGNIDAATSTERLIATMNGFGIAAEDTMDTVSKIIQLDNNFATSTDEISSALTYSSSVAKEAGVTFDQLASYITVISSTTRQSSETIGTALKTLLTRFTQVKAGAAIDDAGESLNNVEKVLKNVNIAIRDSTDSFRPMGNVINDVALRWNEFTEVQKAQIATAIAGKHNVPEHIVIYGYAN